VAHESHVSFVHELFLEFMPRAKTPRRKGNNLGVLAALRDTQDIHERSYSATGTAQETAPGS